MVAIPYTEPQAKLPIEPCSRSIRYMVAIPIYNSYTEPHVKFRVSLHNADTRYFGKFGYDLNTVLLLYPTFDILRFFLFFRPAVMIKYEEKSAPSKMNI